MRRQVKENKKGRTGEAEGHCLFLKKGMFGRMQQSRMLKALAQFAWLRQESDTRDSSHVQGYVSLDTTAALERKVTGIPKGGMGRDELQTLTSFVHL